MRIYRLLKCSLLFLVPAVIAIGMAGCKKEKFLTSGGSVSFSADTLLFDTVFTAAGSATHSILVFNNESQKLKISSIRLAKGDTSPYRLNVNGLPGKEITDIELAGDDSMYVFAAVTIDPTNENSPFLVEDELIVTVNGNEYKVPVIGYGQNAHYIRGEDVSTTTWLTDKPYVVIGSALVLEGQTLTIPAGARVYMHANSTLFVDGTLKINGTKADSVLFQGDRIDRRIYVGEYADIPGEWGGIYFTENSHSNEINYAILKNGGASTVVGEGATLGALIQINKPDVAGSEPVLKITNSVLKNSVQYGLLAFGSSLYAENCLIADCQAESLALIEGGDYRLYDCTIARYGQFSRYFSRNRGSVAAVIQNYFAVSQTSYSGSNLNAELVNCIVYGSSNDDYIYFDKKDDFEANVSLQYSLLKAGEDGIPAFVTQTATVLNQDPLFRGVDSSDYHLTIGSPAANAGISAGTLPVDLDGVSRPASPSIGCFELVP